MKKEKEFSVNYEGMGTCAEAYVQCGGFRCTIASGGSDSNDFTVDVVNAVKRYLKRKKIRSWQLQKSSSKDVSKSK